MRWTNGVIHFDADISEIEERLTDIDSDALDLRDIDFTTFDLEMEESLKDLDISFPVPDLSNCRDAETADAWVKSPRLMLERLTVRLNEILQRCEARSFPGTVIQFKPKYIYTDDDKHPSRFTPKLLFLTSVSAILLRCGYLVDLVNTIQPTPFKGEILVELGKCVHLGDTPEFDHAINCYKGELRKLAVWIKAKELGNSKQAPAAPGPIELFVPPRVSNQTPCEETIANPEIAAPMSTPPKPIEQHQTVRGTVVLESELTRDERDCKQWCIILGYANHDHAPISKTSFHNRIKGNGPNPLDVVAVRGQKYRLRKNQLPTAAATEAARNAIIEAAPPSKRGKKQEL